MFFKNFYLFRFSKSLYRHCSPVTSLVTFFNCNFLLHLLKSITIIIYEPTNIFLSHFSSVLATTNRLCLLAGLLFYCLYFYLHDYFVVLVELIKFSNITSNNVAIEIKIIH